MSKLLKFEGQVVHKLDGQYVRKINDKDVHCGFYLIPKDIHTLRTDLNGDGVAETYKVIQDLRTSQHIYFELMPVEDFRSSRYYPVGGGITEQFTSGIEGLKYNNSLVDQTINDYYMRLKPTTKNCIIPQHKFQKMWNYTYIATEEEYNNRELGYLYGTINKSPSETTYYKLTDIEGELDMGMKQIYIPSIEDIVKYVFGNDDSSSSSSDEERDTIYFTDIYNFFWDSSESDDINNSVWLCDAAYRTDGTSDENLNKNAMFFANRQYGNLINYHYYNDFKVRPLFTFDILKYVDVYEQEIEIVD